MKKNKIEKNKKPKSKESKLKNNKLESGAKTKKSRVIKNEYLYEINEEIELSKTKQQKFNFDKNDLEDEMDTSFIDKKKKKKKETIIEKKVYPKFLLTVLTLIIVVLSSFLVFHYLTFNHHKVKIMTRVKENKVVPENIVFLGDSITDYYDLKKYYPNNKVVNSGVGGDTTDDILKNMEERVYRYNPSKVFLLIGTNDLQNGKSIDEILNNIKKIMEKIKKNRKQASLFIESIYPVNKDKDEDMVKDRKNDDIKEINKKLEEYCKTEDITFINTYLELKDKEGKLKSEYTDDGLHLNDKGYEAVTKKLQTYLS